MCDTPTVQVEAHVVKWSGKGRIRFRCTQCGVGYPNQPAVEITEGDVFKMPVPTDRKLMVEAKPTGGSYAAVASPNYIKINPDYGGLRICISVDGNKPLSDDTSNT